MKGIRGFSYIFTIFLIMVAFLSEAPSAFAYEVNFPNIPGTSPYEGPAQFVQYLFIFGLGLGGILAFAMIVFAGLEWALSGANPSLQQDAKDRLYNAIFGLILLLGAYVILNTINPDLVRLRQPAFRGLEIPPPPSPQSYNPGYNPACVRWNQYQCIPSSPRYPSLSCRQQLGPDWEPADLNCPTPGAGASCLQPGGHSYCGKVLNYASGGPSPVTPFSPDPYPLDIQNMDPEARQSLQNLLACDDQRLDVSVELKSAFRPQAYQDHLKEVFCKYQCVIEGRDPQAVSQRWPYATYCGQYINFPCTPGRYDPHYNSAIANINTEWARHGIVAAPANVSRHSAGCSVDMVVSGINPGAYGFMGPISADDPVHYDHAFCPNANSVLNPPCRP
jgi:hypothetical protein